MDRDFTRAELEAGRQLFAGEWRFTAAAGAPASLPAMRGVEIAFAGRSNVGKSSLINALTGRGQLARISRTPGRTQQINLFDLGGRLMLVDLPGYGFAQAPRSTVDAWQELVRTYLRGRSSLMRVCVLIDARHGPKASDRDLTAMLGEVAVAYQVVLTKVDQVGRVARAELIEATRSELARRPGAHPDIVATSAHAGDGIAQLRAGLALLAAQSSEERR